MESGNVSQVVERNKFLLPKFSAEVEKRFLRDHGVFVQHIARISIPIGALEYLFFFVWDIAQPGMPLGIAFTIRFSFLALTSLGLAVSFTKLFAAYAQQIVFALVALAVVGVVVILSLTETGFVHGIAGVGAVVMFGCTLGCLRFWWSVSFVILTLVFTNILILTSEHQDALSYVLLNSNIFLVPYCSFGILFSYIIEHGQRSRFRDTGVLADWIHANSSSDVISVDKKRAFMCYRRNSTMDVTGRIQDALSSTLPQLELIKDVDVVPFGSDYRPYLGRIIKTCDLMIVIVGKDWVAGGTKNVAVDPLKAELELALNLDIPIIPVLVQDAVMPGESELPETLKPFSFLNAAHVRPDPEFHSDVEKLADAIRINLQSQAGIAPV